MAGQAGVLELEADDTFAPGSPLSPPEFAAPPTPVRGREVLAVGLLIGLADAVIFRGQGFAGLAMLFFAAPALLLAGSPDRRLGVDVWVVWGMLALLAARMSWLGSPLAIAVGFTLLVAFAMALNGRRPHVLEGLLFALSTCVAGFRGMVTYGNSAMRVRPRLPGLVLLSVVLPAVALLAFGALFVLANPDLVRSFVDWMERTFRLVFDWIRNFAPSWKEVVFCYAAGWVAIGLLRPILRRRPPAPPAESGIAADLSWPRAEARLYPALRNTLLAVIALFAVYLVFEFKTLWFREFPAGFYYAGYAHEGAAWLTVALALATVVLSLVFSGAVYADPRLPRLRRLAWIWSLENLVLAAAVYHRLAIYIDFNGMTRLRTVALFGISTVVVGFLLVVWKVTQRRDFTWLLRRQLWTLAAAIYLFALTPVDTIVHSYNVRQVLAGDLAPAVQLSVHPIDAEGFLVLHPLVNSGDEIIREGIQALLAERGLAAESAAQQPDGWTAYQAAEVLLQRELVAVKADWVSYTDDAKRKQALDRFHKYVYQWY